LITAILFPSTNTTTSSISSSSSSVPMDLVSTSSTTATTGSIRRIHNLSSYLQSLSEEEKKKMITEQVMPCLAKYATTSSMIENMLEAVNQLISMP
jgi:6-phosphogluconolactonase/glucosamine-6-phosphate isomerase/deaminase